MGLFQLFSRCSTRPSRARWEPAHLYPASWRRDTISGIAQRIIGFKSTKDHYHFFDGLAERGCQSKCGDPPCDLDQALP